MGSEFTFMLDKNCLKMLQGMSVLLKFHTLVSIQYRV